MALVVLVIVVFAVATIDRLWGTTSKQTLGSSLTVVASLVKARTDIVAVAHAVALKLAVG